MARAERQELTTVLNLEDKLSGPIAAAKAAVKAAEDQTGSFSNVLENARPRIREFGRAGSELAVVARAIGGDFGLTLGPLGDFSHVLGDAGLVVSAFTDLGPRAIGVVQGLAEAAFAAIPVLQGEAAAANEDAAAFDKLAAAKAAAGGAGGLGLIGGAGVALVGTAGLTAAVGLEKFSEAQDKAAESARQAARDEANHELVLALFPNIAQINAAAEAELTNTHVQQTSALGTLIGATQDVIDKFQAQRRAAQSLGGEQFTLAESLAKGYEKFSALNGLLPATERQLSTAANITGDLAGALDALPRQVEIDITQVITTIDRIAANAAADEAHGFGPSRLTAPPVTQNDFFDRAAAERAAADAANKAADEARRKAEELAQANRDKVQRSYDDIRQASDRLFDSLHERHLKAITDAEKLAEKNHDAAIEAINARLKSEEAAHAGPVTAAEQALSQREATEQRRNLVEAVQAAQQALAANRDPAQAADLQRALRDAKETLENFDAQATIDRLKAVQGVLDTGSEAAAQKARDQADADLEAAKAKATAQENAITAADKKNRDDFDRQLEILKKRDEQDPARFLTDIRQLEARNGIFTDDRGFRHIGDVVAAAIKATPPKVEVKPTINVYPTVHVSVSGRDVAAVIQSLTSPTQTPSVRSGAGGRR